MTPATSVEEAVNALWDEGRQRYAGQGSKGMAVGAILWRHLSPRNCIDASIEMLEQHNSHLTAACIAALAKGGDFGDFKRKGRTVTITLPEFWDQVN